MKYTSAALVASALFMSADAHPAAEARLESRAADTCGYSTVALLQAYSAKVTAHYYTTNATYLEYQIPHNHGADLKSQGDAAQVLSSQTPLAVPFYELHNLTERPHFYTTSTTERAIALKDGYKAVGVACYVYPSNHCGTVPLYKGSQPGTGRLLLYH